MNREKKQRLRWRLFSNQNGRCFLCGKRMSLDKFTIDHLVPKSRGGTNGLHNLVGAHKRCNGMKGSSTPEEFFGLHIQRRESELLKESIGTALLEALSD